jgi:hypothetical protein
MRWRAETPSRGVEPQAQGRQMSPNTVAIVEKWRTGLQKQRAYRAERSLIKLVGKELFVLPTHLILINLIIGNRGGKRRVTRDGLTLAVLGARS